MGDNKQLVGIVDVEEGIVENHYGRGFCSWTGAGGWHEHSETLYERGFVLDADGTGIRNVLTDIHQSCAGDVLPVGYDDGGPVSFHL